MGPLPLKGRTCYFVSLKHAPGLLKEFRSLGDALQSRGARVIYLLTEEYAPQLSSRQDVHFLVQQSTMRNVVQDTFSRPLRFAIGAPDRLFRSAPPDLIWHYNFHPLNGLLSLQAWRHNKQGVRAVMLHEPYVEDKRVFEGQARRVALLERLQKWQLRLCTDVVVPSPNSLRLLHLLWPRCDRRTHVVPLPVPDDPMPTPYTREHFSFIGRMDNVNKGLNQFLAIIESAAQRKLNLPFYLLTPTPITEYVDATLSADARKLLTIVVKKRVSDREINIAMRKSRVVFQLHRHLSQSGSLAVAFMNGTPVVARNTPGFSQHVTHKKSGFLVTEPATADDFLDGALWVGANCDELSLNCRTFYERTFSPVNLTKNLDWLLNLLAK